MNTEDFVTCWQAIKLKELGFNWNCNHFYDTETKELIENSSKYSLTYNNHNSCWNCVSAPTLAQARKWLGEVKDVNIVSNFKFHKGKVKYSWYIVTDNGNRGICDDLEKSICDTFEQALSAGIDAALKLIKNEI